MNEKSFENVICTMAAILAKAQCVKMDVTENWYHL